MANENQLFSGGFTGELTDISVELERIGNLSDSVATSLSRGFRAAVLDGKSFRSVLADIGRGFADIALKAAFKPISSLAGNLIESLFAASNPALANVKPFAKGGVLAAPAFFNTGAGLGVAGEAGPEAILPLQRGSDGRLGIGASAGRSISISFNVQASDARSFVGAEAEVSAMLLRAVRRGSRSS